MTSMNDITLESTQEPLVDKLADLPPSEWREQIADFLYLQLRTILDIADGETISPRQRLSDLGLSSQMMVELKTQLERGLGVELDASVLFYPTVGALLEYLTGHVTQALETEETLDAATQPGDGAEEINQSPEVIDDNVARLLAGLEDLPQEELAAILSDLSEELET